MKKEDKQTIQKLLDQSKEQILNCFQEEQEKCAKIDEQADAAKKAIDQKLEEDLAAIRAKNAKTDEMLSLIALEFGLDKKED